MARVVTASQYGGADGDTIGSTQFGFAELSNNYGAGAGGDFSALGNLPRGTKLAITYNGRTVIAPKVDVGAGGPGLGGHPRAIDLTASLAKALGFNGLGNVTLSPVVGGKPLAGSSPVPAPGQTTSSTPATTSSSSSLPTKKSLGSDLLYALLFAGAVAGGAILLGIGLNRAGGGAPARAGQKVAGASMAAAAA